MTDCTKLIEQARADLMVELDNLQSNPGDNPASVVLAIDDLIEAHINAAAKELAKERIK